MTDESGIPSGFENCRRDQFRWRRSAQPPANRFNASGIRRNKRFANTSSTDEKSFTALPDGAFSLIFDLPYLGQMLPQALLGRRSAAYAW